MGIRGSFSMLNRSLFVILVLNSQHIVTKQDETLKDINSTTAIPKVMKAVGVYKYLPLSDPNSFQDLEISVPEVTRNQVLIKIKAASINPIDSKVRKYPTFGSKPRILGIDGSGVVVAIGDDVKTLKVGDEVIFMTDLRISGSNAQYIALDENMVGPKSKKLSFEDAAAMSFAVATAYDILFERLVLTTKDAGKSFLIINSAGGVGSAAGQLANNLGLKVIGTASRQETREFSLKNGAHLVLNHTMDLMPQLEANGYANGVDFVLINYDPYKYWDTVMQAIKPFGRMCVLVDSTGLIDIKPLKTKSITLASENMGTRMLYNTEKYRYQEIFKDITAMIDKGELKSTLTKVITPFNSANVREAHKLLDAKSIIGKIVFSGF